MFEVLILEDVEYNREFFSGLEPFPCFPLLVKRKVVIFRKVTIYTEKEVLTWSWIQGFPTQGWTAAIS